MGVQLLVCGLIMMGKRNPSKQLACTAGFQAGEYKGRVQFPSQAHTSFPDAS
jgi:hypothetical protein